ncbi:hypothetical protein N8K70_16035 [Microbacterium betulae]|uniref:Uncharacterized protein n=1 Tax=Microbacterium betulae TaxID=2981139 RepID=A0AA97FJX7_9MICO|nr:hypothetical protein [Microbacterium sp. AB]WOF22882.1 hypothetical protein N8K70_16035 [Microbacterium sp. AB]
MISASALPVRILSAIGVFALNALIALLATAYAVATIAVRIVRRWGARRRNAGGGNDVLVHQESPRGGEWTS